MEEFLWAHATIGISVQAKLLIDWFWPTALPCRDCDSPRQHSPQKASNSQDFSGRSCATSPGFMTHCSKHHTHTKKSLQINKNDKVLCHKGTCTIYVNMHYVDRLSEAFTSLGLKIPKTNILELRGEFLLQPQRQNTKWSVAMEDLSWVSSPWHLAHSS